MEHILFRKYPVTFTENLIPDGMILRNLRRNPAYLFRHSSGQDFVFHSPAQYLPFKFICPVHQKRLPCQNPVSLQIKHRTFPSRLNLLLNYLQFSALAVI